MDPQLLQAFAALIAGNAAQTQGNPWQHFANLAAAGGQGSSSTSSQSPFGYPATGVMAGQTAGEAAQLYAQMMHLGEQARLIAHAESQIPAPAQPAQSEEELRRKVRELVRTEMEKSEPQGTQASPAKPAQKPHLPDCDEVAAQAQDEIAVDRQRRAYDQERKKESHEVDKKAIRYARDMFQKELDNADVDADGNRPPPKARPLRSVGGYKVEGGFLEVFTRFRLPPLRQKLQAEPAEEPLEKQPEKKKEAKSNVPDKVVSNREKLVSTKKPKEPPYPPKGREPKTDNPYPNINPPPPAVDITKGSNNKRTLGTHLLRNHVIACRVNEPLHEHVDRFLRSSSGRDAEKEEKGYKRPRGGQDKSWKWY